ncbi:MAG: 30S ribosomal protein S16 [Bacteroidia bacterium]
MPVKIRLQRHGKKAQAFFHIVIADGRAPRDGKFIEKIGTYNPTTNPATINLEFEKALEWIGNGAQPTDTCRAILAYKGVMLRNHLQIGVNKGAINQEVADARFNKWLSEKDGKIQAKIERLSSSQKDAYRKRAAEEAKANEAKAAKIVAKNTPPPAEEVAAPEVAPETNTEAAPEANTEA